MSLKKSYPSILFGVLLLIGLHLSEQYSYLLFHSLAEMFSIVVAFGIFIIVWNTRHRLDSPYLMLIGIAYLFVGGLDLVHTLAYTGMGVFPGYGTNLPTQLWIVARYLESLSLLAGAFIFGRKLRPPVVFAGFAVVSTLALAAVFAGVFPDCFVEGRGLTTFKKAGEFIICGVLAAAIGLIWWRRERLDRGVLWLIVASIGATIASEVAFTLYRSPYGLANMVGHYLKIVSFYLIYKALVETGIIRPHQLLFRDLKCSEDQLRRSRDGLEMTVERRTAELAEALAVLERKMKDGERTQAALREAEQSYRTVADFTYDWEYWEDADGRLRYVSPSCERVSGYRAKEFTEDPGLLREIILPDDQEIWQQHRREASEELRYREVQFRIRTRDGAMRWIEHTCQRVSDKDGKFLGFRASNRDITERKRAEADSHRHLEELAHVSRVTTMGELAVALAHELNQPLTAILTNAQAALRFLSGETPDVEEAAGALSDIVADDKRAGEVIQRIRALLRKRAPERIPLDINEVTRDVARFVQSDALLGNTAVTLELDDDLPSVPGDRIQLQQVLLNLIQNAIDAMQDTAGNGQRRLRVKSSMSGQDAVELAVQDAGLLLDDDTFARMLDPFYTTKPGGLGMGLSISRSIIEAHGGRLWPTRNPDSGITVHFTLPIAGEGEPG